MAKSTIPTPMNATYTKEQLCASERFRAERDLLNVMLVSGQGYSLSAVDSVISEFKQTQITEKINGGGC